jgi:hypothetical protein
MLASFTIFPNLNYIPVFANTLDIFLGEPSGYSYSLCNINIQYHIVLKIENEMYVEQ